MSKHTQVELLRLKRQIANRIRFGRTADSTTTAKRIVRGRRHLSLPPLDLERLRLCPLA
jgi:hypothetical protein